MFGLVWFFNYGVPSVPVEHISLRQCHVVWRKHEGGCTVKEIMLHNRTMHVKKKDPVNTEY